jgi:hypothetical protein
MMNFLPSRLEEEVRLACHWVEHQCGCCPYDHISFVAEKEYEYAVADQQFYRTAKQQNNFVEEVIWKEAQRFVDMVRGA